MVPKPSANGYVVCIKTSLPLDFASMFKILRKKFYNYGKEKKERRNNSGNIKAVLLWDAS